MMPHEKAVLSEYSRFRHEFAETAYRLADGTFRLQGREVEQEVDYYLRDILQRFRAEVERFANVPIVSAEVCDLQRAAEIISGLAKWNNGVVPISVRRTGDRYVLRDWQEAPLLREISYEEIEGKLLLVIEAKAKLESNIERLIQTRNNLAGSFGATGPTH